MYLENARNADDPSIAMVLCHDTELSLSQVRRAAKHSEDTTTYEGIASLYIELSELLDTHGRKNEAQAFFKKSFKWG